MGLGTGGAPGDRQGDRSAQGEATRALGDPGRERSRIVKRLDTKSLFESLNREFFGGSLKGSAMEDPSE